jgi:hypothetical protein
MQFTQPRESLSLNGWHLLASYPVLFYLQSLMNNDAAVACQFKFIVYKHHP